MENKGVLIVTANPPAHMEAEFNAWYDLEHLSERMAVPGFESGTRHVQVGVERRYLALYDLRHIDVLQSEDYLAVSGDRATPWTKRIVGACRFRRDVATQIFPGRALMKNAPSLLYARIEGARSEDLMQIFRARPNVGELLVRIFEGAGDSQGTHFLVAHGTGQFDGLLEPIFTMSDVSIAISGSYVSY